MCAAGWGAFLDGWKLNHRRDEASKAGRVLPIEAVGREYLDLDPEEGSQLFYCSNDVALAILRRMAAGERYTQRMVDQEVARADEMSEYGD